MRVILRIATGFPGEGSTRDHTQKHEIAPALNSVTELRAGATVNGYLVPIYLFTISQVSSRSIKPTWVIPESPERPVTYRAKQASNHASIVVVVDR